MRTVRVKMEGWYNDQFNRVNDSTLLRFGDFGRDFLLPPFTLPAVAVVKGHCVTTPTGVHFRSVAHSQSPDVHCHIHMESHV